MSQWPDQLKQSEAVYREGLQQGLHIGIQLSISQDRQSLYNFGDGMAQAGIPMRPYTNMLWLSSGKPITAVAIAQLIERGELDLEHSVSKWIPEFSEKGKDHITLAHLLTHTAGIRKSDRHGTNGRLTSWNEIIEAICADAPEENWIPGERGGYHISSSWYLLGEIIRRCTGLEVADYLEDEIVKPCGMKEASLGMDRHRRQDVRGMELLGIMQDTSGHPKGEDAQPSPTWSTPEAMELPRPGSNFNGPVKALVKFYEMLLNHGQGADDLGSPHVLDQSLVKELTSRHRVNIKDETFGAVMDTGYGMFINSRHYLTDPTDPTRFVPYHFGAHASVETFGHGGAQSSIGFADPEHGLAVACVFNGMPGELPHQKRMHSFLTALYVDLGLAT